MPDEGEEGNAAYSGKLGKRGQVRIFLESCSIPFMPLTFQLTDYIIFPSHTVSCHQGCYFFSLFIFPTSSPCTSDGDMLPRSEIELQKNLL